MALVFHDRKKKRSACSRGHFLATICRDAMQMGSADITILGPMHNSATSNATYSR